jgi:UV DNA damage endonuclease
METNLGYCCINLTLQPKKISVNNSCIRKTFREKGLSHVSKLTLINVRNLVEIIKWNHQNDFKVYRMSSDMIPWMSEYSLKDLPDYRKISVLLRGAGSLALKYGQRLSFHPGPFNVLGSPNDDLVQKTTKELNQHAEIMDLMGLPKSHFYPINIHCNGVYGDKNATLSRWASNYLNLSESAQSRLVVENDDKESMYSVKDLYDGIFTKVNVPITFDYHHHRFNSGGLTEREAFELAMSTWQYHNTRPLFHYSSCRKTFEDFGSKAVAHADYIYEQINDYGHIVDIEVEAKSKEVAVLKYKETQKTLLTGYVPLNEYYETEIFKKG